MVGRTEATRAVDAWLRVMIVITVCSPQTALSRSPGRRDPRTTVDLGTLGHQCVNHFALGWTLLTPSAWICIPHEARRRRRGGSHSARARAMFSTSGPHLDLTLIPMVTVRARVTLSGFDTQGTTAPNEAPCRSRQEATWSPELVGCFGAIVGMRCLSL